MLGAGDLADCDNGELPSQRLSLDSHSGTHNPHVGKTGYGKPLASVPHILKQELQQLGGSDKKPLQKTLFLISEKPLGGSIFRGDNALFLAERDTFSGSGAIVRGPVTVGEAHGLLLVGRGASSGSGDIFWGSVGVGESHGLRPARSGTFGAFVEVLAFGGDFFARGGTSGTFVEGKIPRGDNDLLFLWRGAYSSPGAFVRDSVFRRGSALLEGR